MAIERILIAVKTYPMLSQKYVELVCTAGVREDGSWVRIYPSPFRFLEKDQQYRKYQWIEIDLVKNPSDPRPESFRPNNIDGIRILGEVPPGGDWAMRRKLVLDKNKSHTNLEAIIQAARRNEFSLAIFKPSEILDMTVVPVVRDWEITRKEAVKAALSQGSLFEEMDRSDFSLVRKLPYKFSYRFRDDAGKESTLMIEDWEIGQLFWKCLKRSHGDEQLAIAKVREKYFEEFVKTKDLYLFLGTTHEAHIRKLTSPYVVVGVFYPPPVIQPGLF